MTKNFFENISITNEIETGATSSVVIKQGDTSVLCTVQVGNWDHSSSSNLPLEVVYEERLYAAGRIPAGFFKRETKTELESLTSRLIDRAVRPTISDSYRYSIQLICTVLSYESGTCPDMLSIIGASLALKMAAVPCNLVSAHKISLVNGKWVNGVAHNCNHVITWSQSSAGSITMMDTYGQPVPEGELVKAIAQSEGFINRTLQLGYDFISKNKKQSNIDTPYVEDHNITVDSSQIIDHLINNKPLSKMKHEFMVNWQDKAAAEAKWYKIVRAIARKYIVLNGNRFDGRNLAIMRNMEFKPNLLPTAGNALYSKGNTVVLANATMGSMNDAQIMDSVEGVYKDKLLFQYRFNPYASGEIRKLGMSRRDVGHGNLAKRSIKSLIKTNDVYRIVADVMNSDGSSSMGSVCAAYLALKSCKVDIAPVAGISVGLIVDGYSTKLLVDITAQEDAWGDMDLKVAGTKDGVTSIQMDLKVSSIPLYLLEDAIKLGMSNVQKIINSYPKFANHSREKDTRVKDSSDKNRSSDSNKNRSSNQSNDNSKKDNKPKSDKEKNTDTRKNSEIAIKDDAHSNDASVDHVNSETAETQAVSQSDQKDSKADKQINQATKNEKSTSHPNDVTVKFNIKLDDIPNLIGPKGTTIKSIVQASEAEIDVNKQDGIVLIKGKKKSVDTALKQVLSDLNIENISFGRVMQIETNKLLVRTVDGSKKSVKWDNSEVISLGDYIEAIKNKAGRLSYTKNISVA